MWTLWAEQTRLFEIVVKIELLSRYPSIARQLKSNFLDDRQHVASENTCHQEVSIDCI